MNCNAPNVCVWSNYANGRVGLSIVISKGGNMLLAKTTNIDTGAQSEAFVLCATCYEKLDDAITYANAQTHTDIALATVAEDVEGVCEQCENRR